MKPSLIEVITLGLFLLFAVLMANGWPSGDWPLWWGFIGAAGTWVTGGAAVYIAIIQRREQKRKANLRALKEKESVLVQLMLAHTAIDLILRSISFKEKSQKQGYRNRFWINILNKNLVNLNDIIKFLIDKEDLGIADGHAVMRSKIISQHIRFFKDRRNLRKPKLVRQQLRNLLEDIENIYTGSEECQKIYGVSYRNIYRPYAFSALSKEISDELKEVRYLLE